MTSDRLSYLRNANKQMRDNHRAYVKQLQQIKDDPFMAPDKKRERMTALAQSAQEQLATLQSEAASHAAKIRETAAKGPAPTESAKMQVLRELDKGTSWRTLAQFYADQKDRIGLAALREQLKLEAATGRLDNDPRPDRALASANGMLDGLEKPLLDARELREKEEAREVNACYGAIDENVKTLGRHYQDAQVGQLMGHQKPVQELYNWLGVPDQDQRSNVGATSLMMPVDQEVNV